MVRYPEAGEGAVPGGPAGAGRDGVRGHGVRGTPGAPVTAPRLLQGLSRVQFGAFALWLDRPE